MLPDLFLLAVVHCFGFPAPYHSLMLSGLMHVPTFPFLCPPAQCVSTWRWVKSCQGTMRAWFAVLVYRRGALPLIPVHLPNTSPLPPRGGNTVYGTWGHFFAYFTKERLRRSALRSGAQSPPHYLPLRTLSWVESALVSQCPSYHEFITAIQYQLLWYVWRVPAMATALSGGPLG